MTPKFKTPCFVKVTGQGEQKDICEKLEEIGYKNYGNPFQITSATKIFTTIDAEYVPYDVPVDDTWIDCGENTSLFFALAGMREDTDKGQWFVVTTTAVLFSKLKGVVKTFDNKKYQKAGSLFKVISPKDIKCTFIGGSQGVFRRATTEEIVEHFKSKEK